LLDIEPLDVERPESYPGRSFDVKWFDIK